MVRERTRARFALYFGLLMILMLIPLHMTSAAASTDPAKQYVYDGAGLLTEEEIATLESLAEEYAAKRETDMIVVTSDNVEGEDVVKMTQDFYDEQAPGYDKSHGNAVILMLDMDHREVYLAGFYKAETYLDDGRLDKIREKITPYLSDGDYAAAFELYIKTAYKYMGYEPGVNPDNILFKLWFQVAVSVLIAGLIVGIMAYRNGGRVTVSGRTYENASTSGVTKQRDQYIRTTTTRTKIPRNNSGGSGGGGGGFTGGGHSHSGSRGSF